MGRDDPALAILHPGRLDGKAIEAEDFLLCGVAFKRGRGRKNWPFPPQNKALESEPAPAKILDELIQLFCEKGNQIWNSGAL